jgi:L-alanine-DL-glutamate epimerase-like enolase superfamily enzyme
MKIASVRAYLLSYPFEEPVRLPYWGGERVLHKRDAMFIKVDADNRLAGYAPGPGSEWARRAIEETIAPFLVDRVLADPDALRVHFFEGPGADPQLAKLYCSVEIALYDLIGKVRGVPVSELLGGRVRDTIRLYSSAGIHMAPEACAEEAAAVAELGFRAYKTRPAHGPDEDLRAVRLIREAAAAPGFELMVDAHTWWCMGDRSYSQAAVDQLAQDMAAYDLAWLEEPLPPHDHAGYLRLKEKDLVPLAAGEHEPSESDYLDLILTQAVDYVQMDVCGQGGYAMGRRLFAEIVRQGLRFAFNSRATALDVIAAAHLGVCWPEYFIEYLEYPRYSVAGQTASGGRGGNPFPLAAGILQEPLQIERGYLIVPRAPGLGVAVDESVVERYPWRA